MNVRGSIAGGCLALAVGWASIAHAQDASTARDASAIAQASDAGVMARTSDAGIALNATDAGVTALNTSDAGAVAVNVGDAGALPPGHPTVNTDANGNDSVRMAESPREFVEEVEGLPAGVVLVRVLEWTGQPAGGVTVRLGRLREGKSETAGEADTRPDGVAQFVGMQTGTSVAYRASFEHMGARFTSPPFQLPTNIGNRVQLVRFDVTNVPRSVLISDAQIEISFDDDRMLIAQRVHVANYSNASVNGEAPRPVTFAPTGGLRFGLPAKHSVFQTEQTSMGDQRMVEEDNAAVMKGSIPPTGRDSIELVWQFRVKREGDSADLDFTFPLPVFSMQVATQASPEMTLEVDTMPAGVVREGLPQRVLITGRTMRDPSDPPLDRIRVHLRGIPPDAGPARWWSVILSAVLGVGALGAFVWRRRNASAARSDVPTTTPAELEAQRDAVLEEIRALTREHLAGEVGPETFAKRKRELAKQLAEVLRELDAALTREKQDLPYRAPKSSKRVNKS